VFFGGSLESDFSPKPAFHELSKLAEITSFDNSFGIVNRPVESEAELPKQAIG